jgi:hypothetical protein
MVNKRFWFSKQNVYSLHKQAFLLALEKQAEKNTMAPIHNTNCIAGLLQKPFFTF